MTDKSSAQTRFAARPWQEIDTADMAAGLAVPSMLSLEESRLYHWIGQNSRGLGATIDLGSFAGGSAARLLGGLAASGQPYHLHGYDWFTATGRARERFVPHAVPDAKGVADILPLVQQHLAPWQGHFTLHKGDITKAEWPGGPIETLIIDAAKCAFSADRIVAQFLPHLIAGESLVVHQDFFQHTLPWLPFQMAQLRACFEPLALIAPDCMVFRCLQVASPAALAQTTSATASDALLAEGVAMAQDWLGDWAEPARFAPYLETLRDYPGVRREWQMKRRS